MRIDKFLKNARLIKRRSVAKEACENARVYLNDKPAKPGADVKVGDILKIQFGNTELQVKVKLLAEHMPKDAAETMYEVIE